MQSNHLYKESWKEPKQKEIRFLHEPTINSSFPWAYFYGAFHGIPSKCGVEAILYLSNHHYFTLRYGAYMGTNKREEVYALWILMKTTKE